MGAIDSEHLQLQMLEAQILREFASHERGDENPSKIPKDALEEDLKKDAVHDKGKRIHFFISVR